MKNEIKHTSHFSYRCEYHIVFAPKYRKKAVYKAVRKEIMKIIRELCQEMKVEIIGGEACPDYMHLLVSIPPYRNIARFVETLKKKSAQMILERHVKPEDTDGDRNFWCRGCFVDTAKENTKIIQEYIQNQLEEDRVSE